MADLKDVADSYAVGIVDAAHKARNGNTTMDVGASAVRASSQRLHERWSKYRATEITGEEELLARAAEAKMAAADKSVSRLLTTLEARDRVALDADVERELCTATRLCVGRAQPTSIHAAAASLQASRPLRRLMLPRIQKR